ncbi:MAG: DUF2459 domain-containing protein [Gloeobacteraceae cyanobacterium ES-bin-144]|nr:DUF2459 domain-containing protein [Verrucomicrobiales bacterium]
MWFLRLIHHSVWPVLGAVTLASCGIRLPDAPPITYREPVRKSQPAPNEPAPDVLVWLISDDLHTGMVFPYDWLIESGFIPPNGFGNPKYVTLSWGNRTAYVEKGLHTPWKFFRALFTPSPSVMELIPANWNVVEVCPHQRIWRKLVPRGRGKDLAAFLNDCSIHGPDGKPIVCGTSSWGGGVLLESRHSYFVPRVCNVWTVQAIESLGGDMHPWLAITANGLIRQAEKPPNDFEKIWPGSD